MKLRVAAICSLLVFSGSASYAVDCTTDCGKVASFRYPCPTFRNPRRMCTGREPAAYATCETTKQASCRVLRPVIKKLGQAIAKDSRVLKKAKDGGWTNDSCRRNGEYLVGTIGLMYQTPICAAVNVGSLVCLGFIAYSSKNVADAACTQLCQDKRLNDCR